eukprot:6482565-Amphidinium_carterae.1
MDTQVASNSIAPCGACFDAQQSIGETILIGINSGLAMHIYRGWRAATHMRYHYTRNINYYLTDLNFCDFI